MKQRLRAPGPSLGAVLGVVVLFAAQAIAWAGVVEEAQIQYDRAAALEAQGRHQEAITEWSKIAAYGGQSATDPHLLLLKADALDSLAEAQRQAEQFDASMESFSRILSQYPQFRSACADAALGIAKIYQKREDYPKALEWYGKVLSAYSDKLNRADLARVRIEEVRKKGVTLSPEADSALRQAIGVYERVKQEDEAIAAARKKALADFEAGKVEDAKAALLPQLDDPAVLGSRARLRFLGIALVTIDDKEHARLAFEKALALADNECRPAGYLQLRAEAFFYLEDNDTVLSESADFLQFYSDSPGAVAVTYYRARTYDVLGQPDRAFDSYQQMISRYNPVRDPEDREMMSHALARCGNRLACLGKIDEAKVWLRRAMDEYPGTAAAGSAATSLRGLSSGGGNQ